MDPEERMSQAERDPRQNQLPPQYDVTTFRKKHRLTAEKARDLLAEAGDDRSVADSLARINQSSKPRQVK
jgi:hypothetical protein